MVIATFGPTTGWAGKTISYDDGWFTLDGYGPIDVAAVLEFDRQGHLQWAYAGLREWTFQVAANPPAAAPAAGLAGGAAAAYAVPGVGLAGGPAAATAVPAAPGSAGPGHPRTARTSASYPWVAPLVFLVALGVVTLVATVLAGGRLRDGLGIALTALAVAFLGLFVWAALRPAPAERRWSPALGRGALLAVSGVLCALSLGLAAVLWWMPHYEVVPPADTRIVLDDTPEMTVDVVNHGLLAGTYDGTFSVDGVEQSDVRVRLGRGESRPVTLALPADADPGEQTILLAGTEIMARAVRPPDYGVAALRVEPAIAKVGQPVTITTTVENSGDISGTFPGVLESDGGEVDAQPVEVGPGAAEPLSYTFTSDVPGSFRLRVGDADAKLVVVKPVRLSSGRILVRRAAGGRAHMTVKNSTDADAMVILARSASPRRPVIAVYVRKKDKATVNGIPDGRYVVWDCKGRDWNWYMQGFLTTDEYKRWRSPLKFATRSSTDYWTTSWSDARYVYTQGHSQTTNRWSNWTVTLGSGPSKYTKTVSASGFPRL
jgi:hypothetical protein